jgi:hypothetical protein
MPATKKAETLTEGLEMHGISGPFERISQPGCFVVNKTGDLIRIPDDALVEGRSPTIDIVSREPWFVTKISSDPYLPLRKARAVAADMDLHVNF